MDTQDALREEHHEHGEPHRHHHEHHYEIIVNGTLKTIHTDRISFEGAVHLAFDPVPSGPTVSFTVTYRHAAHDHSGALQPGQSIEIKNKTVFDVDCTDRS